MTSFRATPAKMLLAFVARHRGEKLVASAKAAGARGGTLAPGKSVRPNRVLEALSLADIQQDVVFVVLGREADAVLAALKAEAEEDPKKFNGFAVTLDVPELFLRAAPAPAEAPAAPERTLPMPSGHKLVCVIVNSGYANDVMAEARKAGATGGTILNARGTGTEEDVKFFGITLVPEKEMVFILADAGQVAAIAAAIREIPTLNEPGGGILFDLNVEEVIPLGA